MSNEEFTIAIDNKYLEQYTQEVILPTMFEYIAKNEKLLIATLTKIVEKCSTKEEIIKCLNTLYESIGKELEDEMFNL